MEFNFENSMEELEKLISNLEQGDMSLEESIRTSEKAAALIRKCENYLSECRGKLEILKKQDGMFETVPFDPEEEEGHELL